MARNADEMIIIRRVGVRRKKRPTSRTTRDGRLHATFQEARLQLRPAVLMSRSRVGIDRCKLASRFPARCYALSHPRAQRPHSRIYVKRSENHAYISAACYPLMRAPFLPEHHWHFKPPTLVCSFTRRRPLSKSETRWAWKRSVACCLGDCADDTGAVIIAVAKQGCFTIVRIPGKGQDVLSSCYKFVVLMSMIKMPNASISTYALLLATAHMERKYMNVDDCYHVSEYPMAVAGAYGQGKYLHRMWTAIRSQVGVMLGGRLLLKDLSFCEALLAIV